MLCYRLMLRHNAPLMKQHRALLLIIKQNVNFAFLNFINPAATSERSLHNSILAIFLMKHQLIMFHAPFAINSQFSAKCLNIFCSFAYNVGTFMCGIYLTFSHMFHINWNVYLWWNRYAVCHSRFFLDGASKRAAPAAHRYMWSRARGTQLYKLFLTLRWNLSSRCFRLCRWKMDRSLGMSHETSENYWPTTHTGVIARGEFARKSYLPDGVLHLIERGGPFVYAFANSRRICSAHAYVLTRHWKLH